MTNPEDYAGILTKREHFAGQALQGFFSGVPFPADGVDTNNPQLQATLESCADLCVRAADALVRRLNHDN